MNNYAFWEDYLKKCISKIKKICKIKKTIKNRFTYTFQLFGWFWWNFRRYYKSKYKVKFWHYIYNRPWFG